MKESRSAVIRSMYNSHSHDSNTQHISRMRLKNMISRLTGHVLAVPLIIINNIECLKSKFNFTNLTRDFRNAYGELYCQLKSTHCCRRVTSKKEEKYVKSAEFLMSVSVRFHTFNFESLSTTVYNKLCPTTLIQSPNDFSSSSCSL